MEWKGGIKQGYAMFFATGNPKIKWSIYSDDPIGGNYSVNTSGSLQQYNYLKNTLRHKILTFSEETLTPAYSGLTPNTLLQPIIWLLSRLGAWYNGNQVEGVVIEYEVLAFATVKGAEHIVLQFIRAKTLVMVNAILKTWKCVL